MLHFLAIKLCRELSGIRKKRKEPFALRVLSVRIQHHGHHANNTAELSPARQRIAGNHQIQSKYVLCLEKFNQSFFLEHNDSVVSCSHGLFRSLARDCLATVPKWNIKLRSPNYNPQLYCLLWTSYWFLNSCGEVPWCSQSSSLLQV